MSMECTNCGKLLNDSAKFCGKCGTKVEEVIKESFCSNCGYELVEDVKFCAGCGKPSGITNKSSDSTTDQQRNQQYNQSHKISGGEQKEKLENYANAAKKKGKGIIKDVGNYKSLSKKKKRNIIIGAGAVVALVVMLFVILTPGTNKKVVSQAALEIAEQEYGYKMELKSYDIVDSFKAKSKTHTGDTFKAKMYLVIIEADVKDTEGNIADTVKFGVSVVDPKKSDGYVSFHQFSQAEECTGMDDKEIKDMLKSVTAAYK